jgi:hypothetical protein
MWSKNYKSLLKNIKNESEGASALPHINDNSTYSDNFVVNSLSSHVSDAVNSLKLGCDYLSADNSKFCDHFVHVVLSMLFSGFTIYSWSSAVIIYGNRHITTDRI